MLVREQDSVSRCPRCDEALRVELPLSVLKKRVKQYYKKSEPISAKKYLAFYPLHNLKQVVSLNEGNTPLIPISKIAKTLRQPKLYVKNEGQNPTGVFKDRGSLVELSKARELGAKAVVCASTGNMAASVSAYAAIADIPCYVLIPEGTPLGKLAQAMSYGARVLQIRGTYADCCRLAEAMAKKYKFYLAGDYAFRSEGQKSLALEVVEQLGWRAPDVVIVPVGCGTNFSAIWQGFKEYKALGFIKNLPRMVAVQPEGCSTIAAAWQKKLKKAPFVEHPNTICSAVGIGKPLDDLKALQALQESGGTAITVADSETMKAQAELGSREAIFVEASAALPLAAVKKLQQNKFIKPKDSVVLVATGAGLKDPKSALDAHPAPPSVEPQMKEIDRFIAFKLYAIRSAGWRDRNKTLFTKVPTLPELDQIVRRELNANLKQSHVREIRNSIQRFLSKGKVVAKVDLQSLVEDALSDLTYETRVMRVLDYQLDVRQKAKPRAKVVVKFFGKKLRAKAIGVGPVDAVISAIRRALLGKSPINERLVDFAVNVEAKGTDATTEVSMKLCDDQENCIVATVSSPDIITASIGAFEKGYNILYWKSHGK